MVESKGDIHMQSSVLGTSESNDFFERIRKFPPSSKRLIAYLSNIFLEKDIYDKFAQDNSRVERITQRFVKQGLPNEDIRVILEYFNLTYPESNPKNTLQK